MYTSESELSNSQGMTDSSEQNSQPIYEFEEDDSSEKKSNVGGIGREEADFNYKMAGRIVEEDKTVIKKEKYSYAFTPESEAALSAVLEELNLGHELSPFQEVAINGLLNGYDILVIIPTGMGKMLVVYLFALALRKYPGLECSVVTVGLPLTSIMTDQLKSSVCPVAVLSMDGKLTDSGHYQAVGEAKLSTPIEDLMDGRVPILFGHPESFASNTGQYILRKLKQKKLTRGLILDEFHQGLEGHWETFRPHMVDMVMRQQVWMMKGSPVAALTATATPKEVDEMIWCMGRKNKPIILAENPIQSHHKVFCIRRPPSQCPMTGVTDAKGGFKCGLLHQLRIIVLDKLVAAIREKREGEFKKTIILFRTQEQAGVVHAWLAQQTGYRFCNESPFVMNHSSVTKSDDAAMAARTSRILCWLTTNRMLLGRDIPDINIVVMVRPPDKIHALVQAMGRAGRRNKASPGMRSTSLFYLLFNSQDIGSQMKNMSDQVRQLCLSEECSIKMMREFFVGEYLTADNGSSEQCCGNCSRNKMEE